MQQVSSTGSSFTPLEQAVLHAVCEAHAEDQSALEAQLSLATVVSRKNTGAGFYADFAVESSLCAALGGERLRSGPTARIDGLNHGMGFILWLKDGYVKQLEGYSFGESTTRIVFERVGFEILRS
jgi:hypothetical protein